MMDRTRRYVQLVGQAVDAISMRRGYNQRGDGNGYCNFDVLWDTHNEAAEEVVKVMRQRVMDKIPSLMGEFYQQLVSTVRRFMTTKGMECLAARAAVAHLTIQKSIDPRHLVKSHACRAAASLLMAAGDSWATGKAKPVNGAGGIGGAVLWAEHVKMAQVAVTAALDNVTNPRDVPTFFGGSFAELMTTACTRSKIKGLGLGAARGLVVRGVLARGLPSDLVRAAAFTAAALLANAIPDGSVSNNTFPAASMAVGAAEMNNNVDAPALRTPPPPPPPPPRAATTSSPPSGWNHAHMIKTWSTPTMPAPTDIASSSPWGKTPPDGRPGAMSAAASCAPRSRSTVEVYTVNVLGTTASPMPPTTEKAADVAEAVTAETAGAMARPTSSGHSGGTAAPETFTTPVNVGTKPTARFESGEGVRMAGAAVAAPVTASRVEGIGVVVAPSLSPLSANQGGRALGSSNSGLPVTTAVPATETDAGAIGAGVAASLPPFSLNQGGGGLGSGSSGLLVTGAAPAMEAEASGGDWERMLANVSSPCRQPLGSGATAASSAPGLFPSAPPTTSMATETATGAAAANRLTFFDAFENIGDTFRPPGNNSELCGVGPIVPVAADAAAEAGTAAVKTSSPVVAGAGVVAAAVTPSPVVAGAGQEGAGATVAALPATINPSVAFSAFTPPSSSGWQAAENSSGADTDTGSGDNGPTDDGGDDGSDDSCGSKRKVTGVEGEPENPPCDGGGANKKIRVG